MLLVGLSDLGDQAIQFDFGRESFICSATKLHERVSRASLSVRLSVESSSFSRVKGGGVRNSSCCYAVWFSLQFNDLKAAVLPFIFGIVARMRFKHFLVLYRFCVVPLEHPPNSSIIICELCITPLRVQGGYPISLRPCRSFGQSANQSVSQSLSQAVSQPVSKSLKYFQTR